MAAQDAHGRKSSWAKAPVAPVRLRRGPCYIVIPSTVGVLRGILSVSYLQGIPYQMQSKKCLVTNLQ